MRRLECIACKQVIFYWADPSRLKGMPILRRRRKELPETGFNHPKQPLFPTSVSEVIFR
jgi:hypothetical protein